VLFAKRSRARKTLAYRFVAAIARFLMQIFTRRVWKGGENLNIEGGIIACSNHLSNFDPLVTAHFLHDHGRPPRFLAKKEMFDVPVFGALIKSAGQIPVYRGTADAANALRDAAAAVAAGETAVIYPEGTLTYDPDLWPMTGATGAARLALATRTPVIPIAQWGAQNVIPRWSKGLKLFPPQTMYVTAGPAVDLSDLYERSTELSSYIEATNRIMLAITQLLEGIRGEQAPAERWDRRKQREERKGH
jgi:1-acyl-sn-glycerol-3-phosphate acyltransferase